MPANAGASVGAAEPRASGGEIILWMVLGGMITLLVTRVLRRGG